LDAERARRVLLDSYSVQVFKDGSAALEYLSSGEMPNVMVLDWVMPGISGVEVCRFLRSKAGGSHGMGILLLTSHRDTRQIVEGLSAGANDYLAKPYADEELSARVASLVRSTQLLRRAEDAETVNRRLLETAPDPLFVIDSGGHLSFANAEAAAIFGESSDALLGRAVDALFPGLEFEQLLSQHQPGRVFPPLLDFDIQGRRFSPTIRALSHNPEASAIMSLRDVTERRRLEERRLDFYSIIAHDLRSPLNVIQLRTQVMLLRETDHGPGSPMHVDLNKIQGTVRTLSSMINDFLELASLEGASYRIKRADLDLSALVQHALDEVRPLIDASSQVLSGPHTAENTPTQVVGDAARLGQVISNLLANASKFTPPHGEIGVHLRGTSEYVEVSVSDTGCGIAPEVLPTLFQRYKRADHQMGGTGLGLLIVREIVEAHGGIVGVESTLHVGSRFWVRLPRRQGIALSHVPLPTSPDDSA
jgi:two-component system phosphate regulon sensor histidine kinase PhoR